MSELKTKVSKRLRFLQHTTIFMFVAAVVSLIPNLFSADYSSVPPVVHADTPHNDSGSDGTCDGTGQDGGPECDHV